MVKDTQGQRPVERLSVDAQFLDGNKARDYVDRYFSMNFTDKKFVDEQFQGE